MLRELTWEQLTEWRAYDQIEPIGDHRSDWQAASICAAMANTTMAVNRLKKRFRVKDFLLEFGDVEKEVKEEPKAAPAWHAMKFIAQQQTAIANAAEKKKNRKQ
jgi:hypothetical protein